MSADHEQRRDRAAGVLLGIAAGDQIGGPVRMALQLAASLLERRRFEVDDVRARYLAWYQERGFDTGPVAAQVFDRLLKGVPPGEAVREVDRVNGGYTAGCNPVHRTPPLAMAAFIPDDRLAACARADARITHFSPVAGAAASTAVTLCRALIAGQPWPDARAAAAAGAEGEIADALEEAKKPRRTGYAPHVLGAAVHFAGAAADFQDALDQAFQFAGPANYCPVLTGALAGARWGSRGISSTLDNDAFTARLRATAWALAESW